MIAKLSPVKKSKKRIRECWTSGKSTEDRREVNSNRNTVWAQAMFKNGFMEKQM